MSSMVCKQWLYPFVIPHLDVQTPAVLAGSVLACQRGEDTGLIVADAAGSVDGSSLTAWLDCRAALQTRLAVGQGAGYGKLSSLVIKLRLRTSTRALDASSQTKLKTWSSDQP